MLYNTPALKRAAALGTAKKTSASKCPAGVKSILSPGMLLAPSWASSRPSSFWMGLENAPQTLTQLFGDHIRMGQTRFLSHHPGCGGSGESG